MTEEHREVAPSAREHDYRTASAARRLGYAAIPGDGYSYILHLRPREWPIMVSHTVLGWLLAVGGAGGNWGDSARALLVTLAVWVLFLNGGTLALNSAFDRDDGDVGYLDNPPPVPRHLASFAVTLMLAGQIFAFTISVRLAVIYLVCMLLSVLYSVPPFRLKSVAGADWVINVVGFGALTPLAGWYASGFDLSLAGMLVLGGFAILFGSFYPLTQIYQRSEDLARGDRTLVIALGVRRSLVIAMLLAIAAFILFAAAVIAAGRGAQWWFALVPALLAWLVVLGVWLARTDAMTGAAHKHGMYRALAAWGVTDVMVVVAMVVPAA
jgi:4-hydroxybenzoate polyprenyltransferase